MRCVLNEIDDEAVHTMHDDSVEQVLAALSGNARLAAMVESVRDGGKCQETYEDEHGETHTVRVIVTE